MNTITMMQSVKVKTKPDIVEIKWETYVMLILDRISVPSKMV